MKEFSQFYFEVGWVIASIVGFGVGLTCKFKTVVWWCVLMAVVVVLAYHYK